MADLKRRILNGTVQQSVCCMYISIVSLVLVGGRVKATLRYRF